MENEEMTDVQRVRELLNQADRALDSALYWSDDLGSIRDDIVEVISELSQVRGKIQVLQFPTLYNLETKK